MSAETKQQHTAEPWRTGGNGTIIYDRDGWGIASATVFHGRQEPETSEANARRIVACVNRFAGIPTEFIENGNVTTVVAGRYSKLAEQRDKLLAALQEISDTALAHPYAGVTCGEMARAVIAEIEAAQS